MSRLIADLQRVEARNTELAAENKLLRGIVAKAKAEVARIDYLERIASGPDFTPSPGATHRDRLNLTPDEAALWGTITEEKS